MESCSTIKKDSVSMFSVTDSSPNRVFTSNEQRKWTTPQKTRKNNSPSTVSNDTEYSKISSMDRLDRYVIILIIYSFINYLKGVTK